MCSPGQNLFMVHTEKTDPLWICSSMLPSWGSDILDLFWIRFRLGSRDPVDPDQPAEQRLPLLATHTHCMQVEKRWTSRWGLGQWGVGGGLRWGGRVYLLLFITSSSSSCCWAGSTNKEPIDRSAFLLQNQQNQQNQTYWARCGSGGPAAGRSWTGRYGGSSRSGSGLWSGPPGRPERRCPPAGR